MPSKAALLAAAVIAAACMLAGTADAKLGKLGKLGKIVVTGVVPCSTGSLIDIATSPVFPSTCMLLLNLGCSDAHGC
jgi:hypothetical protein